MIRKRGSSYEVVAKSGRTMGTYRSRAEALKRLRQIEHYKRRKDR